MKPTVTGLLCAVVVGLSMPAHAKKLRAGRYEVMSGNPGWQVEDFKYVVSESGKKYASGVLRRKSRKGKFLKVSATHLSVSPSAVVEKFQKITYLRVGRRVRRLFAKAGQYHLAKLQNDKGPVTRLELTKPTIVLETNLVHLYYLVSRHIKGSPVTLAYVNGQNGAAGQLTVQPLGEQTVSFKDEWKAALRAFSISGGPQPVTLWLDGRGTIVKAKLGANEMLLKGWKPKE